MARSRKSIRPDPYQKPFLKKLSPEQSIPGKLPQFLEPTRAVFDLHSAYGAAGDQPAAIQELTENFDRGERFQCLLGVTGSGKTFTMANVIKNVGKPTLVLTHNKTLAAQLYQEFKAFFPNNAVEYFVSYYDENAVSKSASAIPCYMIETDSGLKYYYDVLNGNLLKQED